jgi:hypothetical protein
MQIYHAIEKNFLSFIIAHGVNENYLGHFCKWLRYYLDFCEKYGHPAASAHTLPHFITKLIEKRQNDFQQNQARQAIQLFYALMAEKDNPCPPKA